MPGSGRLLLCRELSAANTKLFHKGFLCRHDVWKDRTADFQECFGERQLA